MVSELPFVRGEGLCEIIKLVHSWQIETPGFTLGIQKPGTVHYLISVGGIKDHVRNNIKILVTGLDYGSRMYSGESLETVIKNTISTGKVLGNDYYHYEGFINAYGAQIRNLARIWQLPETTVIALGYFRSGLNGIVLTKRQLSTGEFLPYTAVEPPFTVKADYARLSGNLSYEQISAGARAEEVRRRGPESVEIYPAEIIVRSKPASVESQAVAAALGRKASTTMPVTYSGKLYVDPKILALAQQ